MRMPPPSFVFNISLPSHFLLKRIMEKEKRVRPPVAGGLTDIIKTHYII